MSTIVAVRIGEDKAISEFANDLVSLTPVGDERYDYYFSIYAKDEYSLQSACKVLQNANIHVKTISMIPMTYKDCTFDCCTLADIFGRIKDRNNPNVESVCVHHCDTISDGDFYIATTRRNKNTHLMDIFTFNTFYSYCTDRLD